MPSQPTFAVSVRDVASTVVMNGTWTASSSCPTASAPVPGSAVPAGSVTVSVAGIEKRSPGGLTAHSAQRPLAAAMGVMVMAVGSASAPGGTTSVSCGAAGSAPTCTMPPAGPTVVDDDPIASVPPPSGELASGEPPSGSGVVPPVPAGTPPAPPSFGAGAPPAPGAEPPAPPSFGAGAPPLPLPPPAPGAGEPPAAPSVRASQPPAPDVDASPPPPVDGDGPEEDEQPRTSAKPTTSHDRMAKDATSRRLTERLQAEASTVSDRRPGAGARRDSMRPWR